MTRLYVGLEQHLQPELLTQRVMKWGDRFADCYGSGAPEMHAACTSTIKRLLESTPEQRSALRNNFLAQTEVFFDVFQKEIALFMELSGSQRAIDLGCGPALWLPRLLGHYDVVLAVDLISELINYVSFRFQAKRVVCFASPAHEFLRLLPDNHVDALYLVREALHYPDSEWEEVMDQAQRVCRWIFICELFADDLPKEREFHSGTWYRYINRYDLALPMMKREFTSPEPFDNEQRDPCRALVYRQKLLKAFHR